MSALGLVYTALKTAIAGDATTAALLASSPGAWAGVNGKAVYDDGGAPQGGTMPWITVGAGTEFPQNTLRARGWNCTVQVKVTAQGSEATGQAIVRALSVLLAPEEAPLFLTIDGFTRCWVDEFSQQGTLVTTLASVVTREWPVILRVYAT